MENNQENLPPTFKSELLKKLDKKWIIFIVLFIVTGLVFGYVIFKEQYFNRQESNTNNQELKNGWQKYTNKLLGIEFVYPKSWGEPKIDPDYLTDLDLFVKSDSQKDKISLTFGNKSDTEMPVKLTIFSNDTSGLQLYDESIYTDGVYRVYSDDVYLLKDTGDICKYSFKSQYLPSYFKTFCKDGIKVNILEKFEEFRNSSSSPGIVYTYDLDYFLYAKAGNSLFPHIVAEFSTKLITQKKTKILVEDFLKDGSYVWDKNITISDFVLFAKSIKPIPTEKYLKTKTDILSSDSANIKVVKNYYNLLADDDYQTAFSYLVDPIKTKEDFISFQNLIHDQIINEINEIGDNTLEVFLDIQEQNQYPRKYRHVFKVIDNKLQQTVEEFIDGQISIFGNKRLYASERGLKSLVVLQENGKEIIIDSKDLNKFRFYSPRFSPKGRYVKYEIGYSYSDASDSNIYDILNKKLLNKSVADGNFNQEETLYFSCQWSESLGPTEARIYRVPDFSIKTDLLKIHPEFVVNEGFKCSNDEKTNIVTFEFYDSTYGQNDRKIEIYRFDSRTGELLP